MGKLGKGIKISSDILGKATELGAKGAGKLVSSVAMKNGKDDIAHKAEKISSKIASNAEKYSDKIGDSLGHIADKALDKGIDIARDVKEAVKDKKINNTGKVKNDKFITVETYKID
ncbi:MAG: hypothetical protein ACRC41_12530 [Sarcina sp.]